jgi:2-(1,2-epoxy-1,2-dihydrophenyl)acetyl-CoA isomerase
MTELDTGTEHLLAQLDDGVALVTLNRPERRNAMSGQMLGALAAVLERLEVDDEVGCVVVTGAGGAFCAGGDVKGMAGAGGGEGEGGSEGGSAGGGDSGQRASGVSYDASVHRQRLSQRHTAGRLYEMPKPTIAMLPGAAAGAGLSLALACGLRYAASGAILTTAFARVAFAGDYGGTWFLTRLVGSGKARELYYFSERLSAEDAAALGIVNAVFPVADLETETLRLAKRLADGPRVAYRYMKENLNRAVHGELGECLDMEAAHHIHTGTTSDHREAAKAFVEKREPRFQGR